MNIRNYKPGDEANQVAIYNAAAGEFPKFKAATVEEVKRRTQAADFDPSSRFYAEENGKVVGYATLAANGRVSYPWCLKGQEAAAEPLFQAVLNGLKQRGVTSAFAAYRGDWPVTKDFFQTRGFRLVREMVNFIIDIVEMPTPAARPSLPFSPLRREDVPTLFELTPEALRVRSAAELEKHLFENPFFKPDSLFVLRGRTGGAPAAIGILLDSPDYADPRQIDPNNPCFRLGAFGTETMTAVKAKGLFSFLCRPGRDVSSLALDLMGHAAFRLEDSNTASLAAQVPSDVPHLLRFYQQHFRRQGSFPIYERDLQRLRCPVSMGHEQRWRFRVTTRNRSGLKGLAGVDNSRLWYRWTRSSLDRFAMSDGAGATAYLVVRRDDGFGDVYPLSPGHRHTMGRSTTNRFVLKDELCSREHAEVYQDEGKWCLRDLNSLNGTRVNGEILNAREWELSVNDEVSVGRTNLVFVDDLSNLPNLSATTPSAADSVKIKKRLGQTRFLTPGASESATDSPTDRHHLGHDLALLYRLALDMGAANSYQDLARIVLDGLFEAIPADVGAILSAKTNKELEISAHRHRDISVLKYHKVSQFLSSEVMSTKEAVLAEDVSRDRHLRSRESLTELGATSVICAPVLHGADVLGLIHLYCTDTVKGLDTDDLEFAVAVAKQFGNAIHNLRRQDSLTLQNQTLRDQLKVESELVGGSAAIKGVETQIGRVAGTNATVLIRGESGVGKELVARAIHNSSPRKDGPIICLNCAALAETLLESELFGHEKGAFTGATERMVGKFEAAHHGTIFLDEIGEMNLNTQAKLLRVLEGHPFERVGGHTPIRVEVRVVAATNQPLEQGLQAGTFRRDLFFRLQVIEIRVPPLRERIDDIPLLAEHFFRRFIRETGRKIRGFEAEALRKMEAYHWPGNVRELRNVVERAVALSTGPMLGPNDIWLSMQELDAPAPPVAVVPSNTYVPATLEEMEKVHIVRTLEHTDWNKSAAAGILSIERSTLDRKIKAFDLKRE